MAFWILTKVIKKTLSLLSEWQDSYKSLYLDCGPSTKVTSKLRSIDENGDS